MKKNILYLFIVFAIGCSSKKTTNQNDTVNYVEIAKEQYKYDGDTWNNVLISKCFYKNYFFKSVGIPDYNERYSYDYFIYEISNKDTIQIRNTDAFNQDYKKLEKIINQKLKAILDEDAKHEELKSCVERIKFRYYDFNEFGISFRNNDIVQFNISYGMSWVCAPVANGMVEFKLNELQQYLK